MLSDSFNLYPNARLDSGGTFDGDWNIHLLTLSSGAPHPLANEALLVFRHNSMVTRPFDIDVAVHTNLLVLMMAEQRISELWAVDWQAGETRLVRSLAFLSVKYGLSRKT